MGFLKSDASRVGDTVFRLAVLGIVYGAGILFAVAFSPALGFDVAPRAPIVEHTVSAHG
ncbi:MAG: hypothetical protein M0006_12270 [Magnetospirillum sp.]|nr:hypothetical protein [Magnetospirillum sp.]